MALARHGVLALLGLVVSIRALPAGVQNRQIAPIGVPSFYVSWDTGNPTPTPAPDEPEDPEYPAPGKPSDQFSIGTPSGWVSWATDAPAPTPAPEEPDYPEDPEEPLPGTPSDQISLGKPSYSISWDGEGPKTPVPEPVKSTFVSVPTLSSKPGVPGNFSTVYSVSSKSSGKPTTTKKPEYTPKPPKTRSKKSSSPKASSTPKPTPTPTPKPTPPKQSDQISLGTPSGWVSWYKRDEQIDANAKPTSKKVKPTKKPTPTPTPTPTPKPSPTPSPKPTPAPSSTDAEEPQQSDDITLGPPRVSVSWGKREAKAKPTETLPPFPWPTQSDQIELSPAKATVDWNRREAEPQEINTIGLQFPTQSIIWATPKPPTYISWGKRQDEAEPTDVPELPEEPEDPEGPIEIPPFPVPTLPNSIGLEPPKATVIWNKRDAAPQEINTIGLQFPTVRSIIWDKPQPTNKQPYLSWGKRQNEPEATPFPEIPDDEFPEDPEDPDFPEEPEEPEGPIEIPPFPVPNPPNSIGLQPPKYTVIWGKRQEAVPTPTDEATLAPPQATVIWGRDAKPDAQAPSIGLGTPIYSVWIPKASSGGVIWGRDAAPAPTPTPEAVERRE